MNYYQRVRIPEHGIAFTQFIQEIKRYHLLWKQEMTLLCVLSGEIELSIGGQIHTLQEDDVVLIEPNLTFSTFSPKKGCLAMFVYFDPKFFSKYVGGTPEISCSSVEGDKNDPRFIRLRGYLASLMRYAFDESGSAVLSIEARFEMLADCLLRSFIPPEGLHSHPLVGDNPPVLDSIINYINTNYRSSISLDDIAAIGGYNPSYVSHLFKEKTGIGFREYLTRRRLQSAVADLNHTDKTMASIAHDNGFSDIKSFYLNFEKMYNKTPLQYKKLMLSGDFSQIRLKNPQSQHNYSEARVVYPSAKAERKLDEYIAALGYGA